MTSNGLRLLIGAIAIAWPSTVAARAAIGFRCRDAEVLRSVGGQGYIKAFGCQTPLEQLSYGSGARGHTPAKSPIIDRAEFVWRQHDLKPFFTHGPVHRHASLLNVNAFHLLS